MLTRKFIKRIADSAGWTENHIIADLGSSYGDDAELLYGITRSQILCVDVIFRQVNFVKKGLWAIAADLLQCPIEDNSIDGAYMCCVYHLVNDKCTLLSNVYKMLKAGSHFFVVTLSERHLSNRFLNSYFPSLANIDAGRYGTIEELQRKAEKIGFDMLRHREYVLRHESPDEEFLHVLVSKCWSSLVLIPESEYQLGMSQLLHDMAKWRQGGLPCWKNYREVIHFIK